MLIQFTKINSAKGKSYVTEVLLLGINLSIYYALVISTIYDKRDDFDFDIVNFTS